MQYENKWQMPASQKCVLDLRVIYKNGEPFLQKCIGDLKYVDHDGFASYANYKWEDITKLPSHHSNITEMLEKELKG